MATTPEVSVLMPVYNAAPYLEEAVASVLAQTFRGFELVAVDDGSSDDSLAILNRYAAADPRVRVFPRPHRGIVPISVDAVALSAAPLLARRDADDVTTADRLALQVEFLRRNPDHVLVGSRYAFVSPSGERIGAPDVPLDHDGIDAYHMSGRGCVINQCSAVFRRETYLRVGGYRNPVRGWPGVSLDEDFDLWLRMAEVGKLAMLDRELVVYRIHSASTMRQHAGLYDRVMWQCLREAVLRRGYPLERIPFAELGADEQVNWIDLALDIGNVRQARAWAWRRVRRSPTPAAVKQFGKAAAGRWLGAVLPVYDRLRGRPARRSAFDRPGSPVGAGGGGA